MAHTYASNFIHCVFSTKERRPLIAASRMEGLYAYLTGIAKSEGFPIGCTAPYGAEKSLTLPLPHTEVRG